MSPSFQIIAIAGSHKEDIKGITTTPQPIQTKSVSKKRELSLLTYNSRALLPFKRQSSVELKVKIVLFYTTLAKKISPFREFNYEYVIAYL